METEISPISYFGDTTNDDWVGMSNTLIGINAGALNPGELSVLVPSTK